MREKGRDSDPYVHCEIKFYWRTNVTTLVDISEINATTVNWVTQVQTDTDRLTARQIDTKPRHIYEGEVVHLH